MEKKAGFRDRSFTVTINQYKEPELNRVIEEVSERFGVSKAKVIKAIAECGLDVWRQLSEDAKSIKLYI